jgi:predicted ArsR family transcriptional regulator
VATDSTWTFLSNHAHVLILLGQDPDLRMRDLAERIGITERAVQRIVAELSHEGYLQVFKEGRRNHYRVRGDLQLRHPVEAGVTIEALLQLVLQHAGLSHASK